MTIGHMSTPDTPIGPFTTLVAGDGAVLASGWTAALDDLLPLIAAPLRSAGVRLRSGGSLSGYRWGLGIKRWLLTHESAATSQKMGNRRCGF